MKLIRILMQLAIIAAITFSCTKDLDTYEGENGIYFDTRYGNAVLSRDTIRVSWGMKPSSVTSQTVGLRVLLMGNTAPYDRKFNVEVGYEPGDENGAEAGIDYVELPREFCIPANEAETTIEVTLLRRQGLAEKPRRVTVKLVESKELKFLYTRTTNIAVNEEVITRPIDLQRVIYMSEGFPQPAWWSYYGTPNFGTWSEKKAALICDVMNIDREDWVTIGKLEAGFLTYCGRFMHRWLQENPQTEEDGTPMEMGYNAKI